MPDGNGGQLGYLVQPDALLPLLLRLGIDHLTRCGLAREESRGAHTRSDFPERREEYCKHSFIRRGEPGVRFE